jgi:ABC-2 type transport system ATP-binding protein
MTDTEQAIRIRGLKKDFGRFKLGPLDLNLPRGCVYGLIGPNAAGKTTTLNLIVGIGQKDAGDVRLFGLDHVEDEVAVKSQLGYVNPDLILWPWGRVNRLIDFVRPFYPDWDDAYCEDLMRRLNIAKTDKISTMSFGSRIKLGLLLALSHHPALLLLDEPLAGLDAVSRHEIFNEILAAVQDESRSVLISSHDLHDLERITDHIGFINNGKMILEGPTAEIVSRFNRVNAILNNGSDPASIAGVHLISREDKRVQLLIDESRINMETLASKNITLLDSGPVTLEDIFVTIVKG